MKALHFLKAMNWGAAFLFITSCNVWAPFQTNTSDEDHLEVAEKCLIEGDYDCALDNYQLLTNGDLKNQKLCTGYLAKAGATISLLLDVVTQDSQYMMGNLAQALTPWTATKGDAAAQAQIYCTKAKTSGNGETGVLLQALGNFFDCATRIAKTDVFLSTDDNSTSCDTPGPNAGTLTQSSICNDNTGAISSGNPGMCPADVIQCNTDLSNIAQSELSQSGLGDIAGALGLIPSNLIGSSLATDIVRAAIRSVFAN